MTVTPINADPEATARENGLAEIREGIETLRNQGSDTSE